MMNEGGGIPKEFGTHPALDWVMMEMGFDVFGKVGDGLEVARSAHGALKMHHIAAGMGSPHGGEGSGLLLEGL